MVPDGPGAVEFLLLGSVEALRDGRPVPLGPRRQRAVLARLLVDRGRSVPVDLLLEDVWGGRPPAAALPTLRSYLSRLRSALAPAQAIVTRGGGYALEAGEDAVDAARFEALAADGRALLRRGNPRAAAARLTSALALWRGEALAGLPPEPFVLAEAARLEDLRLGALEDRLEADLALGDHAAVVAELDALAGRHPLRERPWALLMTALYRCGRQAEALEAYQRARRVLRDELGLEPGAELRALQTAILRHELPPPDAEPPHGLPVPLTPLVGREDDVQAVVRALGASRLVTLTGVGGVGKTRLAVEAAHRVRGRFGAGTWFAELAEVAEPELLAAAVAGAAGIEQRGVGPAEAALAEHLASADALLVLDNCEHLADACARLVERLLQRCPRVRVLATSRTALAVPGERVRPVAPLPVPPAEATGEDLTASPAVALLLDRAPEPPAPEAMDAVVRICRDLDGLPLAIEIAAAQLRTLTAPEIADRLGDRFRLLAWWSRTAPPRQRSLRASLDWSEALLGDRERDLLRTLSVFSGGWPLTGLEAVCGDVLPELGRLVDASLVVRDGARSRLLETVRQHAWERLAAGGGAGEAVARHAAWCSGLADAARAAADGPTEPAHLAVLDDERANLGAALERAWQGGDVVLVAHLARGLARFWVLRGLLAEAELWLGRALQAGAGAPPALQADVRGGLGLVALRRGRPGEARPLLQAAVRRAREAGDPVAEGRWSHALAFALRAGGDRRASRAVLEAALGRAREAGDDRGAGHRLGALADLAVLDGRLEEAARRYAEAWALVQPAARADQVPYLHSTAELALLRGDLADAADRARACLAAARDLGDRWHVGLALRVLAAVARRTGDAAGVRRHAADALAAIGPLGDAAALAAVLDELGAALLGEGDARTGSRLLGAADGLRQRAAAGATPYPGLSAAPPVPVDPAERAAGAALTTADALALAREGLDGALSARPA